MSIGFVGTYPPTRCGIATFTLSLVRALAPGNDPCSLGVVACVDAPGRAAHPPDVVEELVRGSEASLEDAAAALRRFDVAVVQHEFGIYGGDDGRDVLELVARLGVPTIVVLHTVLRAPSENQREIVERLAEHASVVVAQSRAAGTRLLEAHDVEPAKVRVIPHGATANLAGKRRREYGRRPVVLTWGLIGPSKGLEWGIEAMVDLRDLSPLPRYVIAGQTHPRIIEQTGEAYRRSLIERAAALGVSDIVEFDEGYRDTASILARIRAADVVLLPYLSREQVVSGVLVEAIASGKPVVSTRFPHAEELLSAGSGLSVPHEDSEAISDALRLVLTDPDRARRMAAAAREQAPTLFWENVAGAYLDLAREVAQTEVEVVR